MLNNKIIGLVIPLRFNSERLQGKVLMDIFGKKQIEWIIERSLKSKYLDCIVLAVSEIECDEIDMWYFNEEKIFDKYNEKVLHYRYAGCAGVDCFWRSRVRLCAVE